MRYGSCASRPTLGSTRSSGARSACATAASARCWSPVIAFAGNNPAAEELLRQAVAEDPRFASAWIHLAWALVYQAIVDGGFR